MIRPGLLCALFMLSGCGEATAPSPAPAANVGQAMTPGSREAALAAITDHCELPRAALRMDGDMLTFNPPPNASQAKIDCLLREISLNSLTANLRMGFVGNELPEGDNVQGR